MRDYNVDDFKTFDLALAAALVTAGYSIERLEKTPYGKASFIFTKTDSLNDAVNRYWADRFEVNPKTYFDAIKHIKTRIYAEA